MLEWDCIKSETHRERRTHMRRSVNLQDVNSTLQCSPLSVSLGLHVNLRVTSALRTGYVYTTAVAADTMTALVAR